MKFTAAMYLAALAAQTPSTYEKDPGRFAVIAVAAAQVQEAVLKDWRYGPEQLAGALVSALVHESGLREDVHSGELRGRTGDICLAQIHPRNTLWKSTGAPSFESLAGVSLEATKWCLHASWLTLRYGARYCHSRRYYKNWRLAMWTMYATGRRCSPWYKQAKRRTLLQDKVAGTKWSPTEEHTKLVNSVLEER